MSIYYSNIQKRKFNTWCKYTTRIDTYGCGCSHDCSYCYAKSLLKFRGLWNNENPNVATLWEIKKVISGLPKNVVVKLGGMTDCFMPLELKHRVTYNTIKMLNHYKIHYLIVTKSHLVANDEYIKIYDKKYAHFQITITSTNNSDSLSMENASLPQERIQAIEKLYNYGYDVSIRLSPFIIEFVDLSVINAINCDKILIEFLKVNHWVKRWFKINYAEYSLSYGGYRHLQIDRKIELVNMITGFDQKSVGEYVKSHHEHFNEYVNFNKNDCCNLNVNINQSTTYNQLKITFN